MLSSSEEDRTRMSMRVSWRLTLRVTRISGYCLGRVDFVPIFLTDVAKMFYRKRIPLDAAFVTVRRWKK